MEKMDLCALLRANSYPGRGIVVGLHEDGIHAVILYFIMGRSENSRNRIFVAREDGGIMTKAFDESKMVDPSLIIYSPVRLPEAGTTVVTNGDQTDTICDFILAGKSFEEALRTRTFEPDPPNYTPRISGILDTKDGFSFKLSILRSADGNGDSVQRFFYEYPQPVAGEGRFIHTYEKNGNPIPSFSGEPERVGLDGSLQDLTDRVWNALNPDNKVSLYSCFINTKTGAAESLIVNKHA